MVRASAHGTGVILTLWGEGMLRVCRWRIIVPEAAFLLVRLPHGGVVPDPELSETAILRAFEEDVPHVGIRPPEAPDLEDSTAVRLP